MKKSLSHTVRECKYHIAWVPKKQRKVVYGKLRQKVIVILRRLSEYKGVEVMKVRFVLIMYTYICQFLPGFQCQQLCVI